jgi:hypothetical protein
LEEGRPPELTLEEVDFCWVEERLNDIPCSLFKDSKVQICRMGSGNEVIHLKRDQLPFLEQRCGCACKMIKAWILTRFGSFPNPTSWAT